MLFNSSAQSEQDSAQDSAAPAPTHFFSFFFSTSQQELSIGISPTASCLVVFSQAKTTEKEDEKEGADRSERGLLAPRSGGTSLQAFATRCHPCQSHIAVF